MALYILAIVLHSMQQKWDQGTLGTQGSTLIGSRTRLTPLMDPAIALQYTLALYRLAIFFHTMQQKWDQGSLGRQRVTLIGSRTHHGPSMDPDMALQYTKHGPLYIGYIFALYTKKLGLRDSVDTKVHPHWV